MTLEDLRTEVWDRLGEDPDDPQRYSAADVLEYLNDGVQTAVSRAGLEFSSVTITQRPGQLFYDLPTDLIHVTRVKLFVDGNSVACAAVGIPADGVFDHDTPASRLIACDLDTTTALLEPIHHRELDSDTYKWTTRTGKQATHYGIFGLNEIYLWPLIATGTLTYDVEYLGVGTTFFSVRSDTPLLQSTPTLPDQFHEAIIDYAVSRCLLIDGDVEEAMEAYEAFQAQIGQAKARKGGIQRNWGISGGAGYRNLR